MRYQEIVDAFADEATHIKALISARNATLEDDVSQDFIEVLREEGYVLPDLADFEEVA